MFKEFLDFLMETLSIISVQSAPEQNAPFGKENRECLDLVLKKCAELGFKTTDGDGFYGFADADASDMNAKPYYIIGHLDVVSVGGGWTRNPAGERTCKKIYGRGVVDDKGPMLACVFAAHELLKTQGVPKRPLRFIFGCNEESGWQCMNKYVKAHGKPDEGFSPDGDFPVINCEKGILYCECETILPKEIKNISGGHHPNIVMDECNVEFFDGTSMTQKGKSAHGSHPEAGKNAFLRMLKKLKKYPSLAKIYTSFNDFHGSNIGIDFEDEKSGKLTVNIGKAWTENKNLHFTLDIRYPISANKTTIIETVSERLPFLKITEIGGLDSLYVAPTDELVQNLLAAYKTVTGKTGKPLAIGGGTYARAMTHGVAFGPQFPNTKSTVHQKNECAKISELKTMYKIYREAIKNAIY